VVVQKKVMLQEAWTVLNYPEKVVGGRVHERHRSRKGGEPEEGRWVVCSRSKLHSKMRDLATVGLSSKVNSSLSRTFGCAGPYEPMYPTIVPLG
jgi:hypothetical protein